MTTYDLGPELEHAAVDSGTNILVSGPPLTGKRRLVLQALAYGAAEGQGIIIVTTRDSAERMLADFESVVDKPEAVDIGIVDCVSQHQGRSTRDTDIVKYASSPEDMTGIGIKFSEFVEEFSEKRGVEQIRVMVDSLSTLLLYSNLQTVFRFMHVFTSRMESADAVGLHVMDATAHDVETMNTLKQLFGEIVETDDDLSVTSTLAGSNPERAER